MKLSKQGEYGLRAMLYFAAQREGRRLSSKDIAEQERIPTKFLEQILARLRKTGLLVSQKGSRGGYQLAKATDQIMLAEVIRAIDGPLSPWGDEDYLRKLVEKADVHCGLYKVLLEVRDAIASVLEKTTLMDVVRSTEECLQEKKKNPMYYI